jgi:hypothetical protein
MRYSDTALRIQLNVLGKIVGISLLPVSATAAGP